MFPAYAGMSRNNLRLAALADFGAAQYILSLYDADRDDVDMLAFVEREIKSITKSEPRKNG
jgi:hypothetical protein